jgi:hypothetical protein
VDDFGTLSSAEVCDSDGDTCVLVGSMAVGRQFATATLLNNGRVLIAGGDADSADCTGCATATAELYDPVTQTFSPTGSMHTPRIGHTATGLPDDDVLIAGGLNDNTNTVLDSTELYNPANGTFSVAATMTVARSDHTASVLADGKVLIAGGFENTATITDTAELYDPLEAVFAPTGNMTDARAQAVAASFMISAAEDVPRRNRHVRRNLAPTQTSPGK